MASWTAFEFGGFVPMWRVLIFSSDKENKSKENWIYEADWRKGQRGGEGRGETGTAFWEKWNKFKPRFESMSFIANILACKLKIVNK